MFKKRNLALFTALILIAVLLTIPAFAVGKKDAKKEKEPEKPITIDRIVSMIPFYNYDLSPDGKEVLFLTDKGGYSIIYRMDREGGYPTQITGQMQSFSQPKWSPDGKKILALSDSQLWVMDADGRNPKKLTKHEAGVDEARWSPDGKTIAYYTRRKGWDQIWLMDADGKNKRQLIKITNDFYKLSWSPDGKYIVAGVDDKVHLYDSHVYIFPTNGDQPKRLTPANNAYDFAPVFTKDGKYIVFISNRDGWDHIYRMNLDGSGVTKLSSGNYEHEDPFPSPDGKWVAYLRDNKGTRDLMKVSIDGGEPIRIDKDHKGVNFIEAWTPDSKYILAQFSSPMEPWSLWLYKADGTKAKHLVSSFVQGLKPSDFPKPEFVTFKARDGLKISGYIIKPKNMKKGKKYPAVIYTHGGPTWQFGYRWKPFLSYLAQEGYVVFGVDIRGSTGYGVTFQKANDGQWGNKDMFDLVDAKRWLVKQGYVDNNRVAIYGGSYGGYMTLCAMTRAAGEFACGAALYGDSDIAESYKHGDRGGRIDLHREMGPPDTNKEIYKRGSPVFHAENVTDPILIQHGKQDMRVVPLMSELMVEKLKIEGKFYKIKYFEDEPHGFYAPENEKESLEMIFDFLEKYCKGDEEEKEKK